MLYEVITGKRIGVLRNYDGAGNDPNVEAVYAQAIATLEASGAEIVDPIEFDTTGLWEAEEEVFAYELKAGIDAYLKDSDAQVKSLADVISANPSSRSEAVETLWLASMSFAQARSALHASSWKLV